MATNTTTSNLLSDKVGELWSNAKIFVDVSEGADSVVHDDSNAPMLKFGLSAEPTKSGQSVQNASIAMGTDSTMPTTNADVVPSEVMVVNSVNDLTQDEINEILLNFVGSSNECTDGPVTATIVTIDDAIRRNLESNADTMSEQNADDVIDILKLAMADTAGKFSLFILENCLNYFIFRIRLEPG